MKTPSFIHLHVHSEYSLSEGLVRIPSLVEKCRELGQPAVGLTDISNLFALPKFYRAARGRGIKPITGCELRVESDSAVLENYSLIALCQDSVGYKNLCHLITRAHSETARTGEPLISEEWLTETALQGLIILAGGLRSDLADFCKNKKLEHCSSRIEYWTRLLGDRYYIGISRTGREAEERYIEMISDISQRIPLAFVAINDVCFIEEEDFEAHEARVCINSGRTLNDPRRPRNYSREQFLRSEKDMVELFSDFPTALQNSVSIAMRCNLELDFGSYHLPEFPVQQEKTVDELLRKRTSLALKEKIKSEKTAVSETTDNSWNSYEQRLNRELEVIMSMGFSGYFLIVADFISWAKKQGIPVGPGRGSGAGSLAAFVLGITEIDPIEYDLLFERFLNPERVSMPDFDIDFCMERRDEVIGYVSDRYGRDKVAQIITYGRMAAKAVLRDVGRVLGFPYGFIDQLAKLVPFDPNMTLKRAMDEEPILKARYKEEEDVGQIIDLALQLEGLARSAGRHAGGLVIAPRKLTEFMPLYSEQGGGGLVTQYDMGDVEAIGLVKFDFLGLRTLTIIDWAVKEINLARKVANKEQLDITDIPLNDPDTFKFVRSARTTAVFQLESRGIKELIKRLKPDNFSDLVALVALFRPGPLQSGMVDDFIDRKHGHSRIRYSHPALEPILNSTYGVILYQEQVMQIARTLAGYTLGAADLLRRAMGKKKVEEMAEQRKIFLHGSSINGLKESDANAIFDVMEKFAGYGFNKSHSVAYALIAYQTAWLKTHHPEAFMAAVLSSDMDKTDKVVGLISECRKLGITVLPPTINKSLFRFSVSGRKRIRYGLGALKGLGEGIVNSIVGERQAHGAYTDLIDLCRRNVEGKLNRRTLEALIKSGSLDDFGSNRSALTASIEQALQLTEQEVNAAKSGQEDLFGLSDPSADSCGLGVTSCVGEASEWTKEKVLAAEKETLGLYLSGHPLDRYREELKKFVSGSLVEIRPGKRRVVGLLIGVRIISAKRGRMAVANLDDQTARVDVTVLRDAFEASIDKFLEGQLVVIEGNCSVDKYTGDSSIEAARVYSLEEARNRFAKKVVLKLTGEQLERGGMVDTVGAVLSTNQGDCPVVIDYSNGSATARLRLGPEWKVRVTDRLVEGLQSHVGERNVHVEY